MFTLSYKLISWRCPILPWSWLGQATVLKKERDWKSYVQIAYSCFNLLYPFSCVPGERMQHDQASSYQYQWFNNFQAFNGAAEENHVARREFLYNRATSPPCSADWTWLLNMKYMSLYLVRTRELRWIEKWMIDSSLKIKNKKKRGNEREVLAINNHSSTEWGKKGGSVGITFGKQKWKSSVFDMLPLKQ